MRFRCLSVTAPVVSLLLLLVSCANRQRALTVHLADYSDTTPPSRVRVDMPNGEAALYADPASVLDDRDFTSVSFGQHDFGRALLRLCFAAQGRSRFVRVAQSNLRRRLVFLLRGKLLFAPVIESATPPECLEISGAVTPEEAAALQRVIR